jgi:hypothetical protein
MVQEGAHTYEFGDQGSILVIADDEDVTDHVHYSYDGGKTWCVQVFHYRKKTLTLQEQVGSRPHCPISTAYDHPRLYLAEVSSFLLVISRANRQVPTPWYCLSKGLGI